MVTGNRDNVRPVRIEEEMRSAYLDYAMSVIVARALPDVRDGLKPVHRRILYAMQGMGLRPGSSYKKSAAVVGEVLGKYHPHGDSPVYDALVRMAQNFSMRHTLVDGQGNFGSVDDDPPAAMRYTEARLAPISEQLLQDIDRDTIDFVDNYDGSQREPTVLPARVPNLLVNGASGIAVGMATNIPPHNLREVCDALDYLVDNPEATPDELMQFVQGPDFPTAATIMGREGIQQAYQTGHGRIMVRARATVEDMEKGARQRIVVSELPYQVNKAALVEKIATLTKEKKIDGISEVRDESDREGMRMVVELQRNASAGVVLNNLYQHTSMQNAFHVNMVALVDGQPRVMNLRSALNRFLDFRKEVIRRRAEYDLNRARERAHILEGLRIALENLDEVIALIRASADAEAARNGLMQQFGLTEAQSQAILEMQLRRLAALERERIENEYQELMRRIAELQDLLSDPTKVLAVVKTETAELRKTFGNARRTEISDEEARDQSQEELTPHADVVFTLSDRGYIKRLPIGLYRLQKRGGKGVRGQERREGDAVQQLVVADTHDYLLFFTDKGRVYRKRVFEVGEDSSRQTRGTPIQNLIEAINPNEETVTAVVAIPDPLADLFIFMTTRKGKVKKMHLDKFQNIRRVGLAAFDLEPNDSLLTARLAEEGMTAVLISRKGKGVQFSLDAVTERQGRSTGGVGGMRLLDDDEVVAMEVVTPDARLLIMSELGYGKRTAVETFRTTGRNTQGVIAMKITEKTGPIAGAVVTGSDDEEIMVGSRNAIIYRTSLAEIRTLGRNTQGVKIMTKLADDDVVISMSAFRERTWEDFEKLPKVEPKKARAASTNGHASAAVLDETTAEEAPEPEEPAGDEDAPEAETALEDSEAGDADEAVESDETPSGTSPVAEVAEDDSDPAANVAEGTTLSMWHIMDAPLFPEAEESEEDGA
ncbi:MAG: DNA gyrase subunit A [Chloroflexi bacterium]|nr:DNA gyrase subunit A [Chloroflexota bacterium]